eukprot:gene12348-15525_t
MLHPRPCEVSESVRGPQAYWHHVKSLDGRVCLHASSQGHAEVVRMLLEGAKQHNCTCEDLEAVCFLQIQGIRVVPHAVRGGPAAYGHVKRF